jgi:hypothetical protein
VVPRPIAISKEESGDFKSAVGVDAAVGTGGEVVGEFIVAIT